MTTGSYRNSEGKGNTMSPQTRIHDYRGPRSSEDLNRKVVGILQPGVYEGFNVAADGTISPGVLLTKEGVRIEEDQPISITIPPNTYSVDRHDLWWGSRRTQFAIGGLRRKSRWSDAARRRGKKTSVRHWLRFGSNRRRMPARPRQPPSPVVWSLSPPAGIVWKA